jgi:hypothetical protein
MKSCVYLFIAEYPCSCFSFANLRSDSVFIGCKAVIDSVVTMNSLFRWLCYRGLDILSKEPKGIDSIDLVSLIRSIIVDFS